MPPKQLPYTQRTLAHLRELGYAVGMVERYNSFTRKRYDLFNLIDLVAISDSETIGVQSTSWAARREHLTKINETYKDDRDRWLKAGRGLWLVSWKRQKVKRGGLAFRYVPVVEKW